MSNEIELTEDWPVEKTKERIQDMNDELDRISEERSKIDKQISQLEHEIQKLNHKKKKLDKKESNNVRYKNAMIDDLIERNEWER